MTHVVTDACIRCTYTDCVDLCPVDCFKEDNRWLVIDPKECIDCAVFIPERPINAIYAEEDLPEGQGHFLALNREYSAQSLLIGKRQAPLPEAEHWATQGNKWRGLQS